MVSINVSYRIFKKMIKPEDVNYNHFTFIIIIMGISYKVFAWNICKEKGREVNSDT